MRPYFFTEIIGKMLFITGVLLSTSCFWIFRKLVVPLLGWEIIVGKTNVIYSSDHTKIIGVTNPVAWILWWFEIVMIGLAIATFGKIIQCIDRLQCQYLIRLFVILLIVSVCMGSVLLFE